MPVSQGRAISTYRLQFGPHLNFNDAASLVPYLAELGISDLYASPFFQACRGSTHGYDVISMAQLNPELGTREDFEGMILELRAHRIGLLLDIVPNHMAASLENRRWFDVLENGPDSAYADYFDIDWKPVFSDLRDKVLLPILGKPYAQALENQELRVGIEESGFYIYHYDLKLPVNARSYPTILSFRLKERNPVLVDLIEAFRAAAADPQPLSRKSRIGALKRRMGKLYSENSKLRSFIDETIRILNGSKEDPSSFNQLDQLLDEQAYRFAYWRTSVEKINYRRFFNISNLIGVRVEDPSVFETTHRLIFQLIGEGKVSGLRIDHADGLFDPLGYLHRLQGRIATLSHQRSKDRFYIIVEKILLEEELLPGDWPVNGTTGYEYLKVLNGIFVDSAGIEALDRIYQTLTGSRLGFAEVVYEKKKEVLNKHFAGEMHALENRLRHLAGQDRYGRDLTIRDLRRALDEVTICLSVYRTYIRNSAVADRDRLYIGRALEEAARHATAVSPSAFSFLKRVLLLDFGSGISEERRREWLQFVMRWQQVTGPTMAKGCEDTALYVYNRLVSLNEVGGDPQARNISLLTFHQFNTERQRRWPFSLSATSTHDTKRGEDVRTRIHVLSELPEPWGAHLDRWRQLNADKRQLASGVPVPGPNVENLLYQTLVGAWPLNEAEIPQFNVRVRDYMLKAVREAKVHTRWSRPNKAYEDALMNFIGAILMPSPKNKFLEDFLPFQERIAFYGALGSLSQVVLKIASPGIPDFYQGTELWNLSLVDPDNRRPVDFVRRTELLQEVKQREKNELRALTRELLAGWKDGRIKLYIIYKALHFRLRHSKLFQDGSYLPLAASGDREPHVCAFARRRRKSWAIAAVPRLATKLTVPPHFPLGKPAWGAASLVLPQEAPDEWRNLFTGEILKAAPRAGSKEIPLRTLFQTFPVALLYASL